MRIISLVPAHTEILFSLGLGEQIVGVSANCDYPRETVDGHRCRTIDRAAIAELAVGVIPPRPHRAILLPGQGVNTTCRNLDHPTQPGHGYWRGSICCAAVAELPVVVSSPSRHRAVFSQLQTVSARRDSHRFLSMNGQTQR